MELVSHLSGSLSVLVLCQLPLIFFFFLTVMASHMWAGRLRQVCVEDETGLIDELDER